MDHKINIDDEIIEGAWKFLYNEKHALQLGNASDMDFIMEGAWLKDSAVIDVINKCKGGWDVYLIFVHYKNPLQLLIRNITRCYSEQKAMATAFYIKKEAAKDRRGTLQISVNDFNLCNN